MVRTMTLQQQQQQSSITTEIVSTLPSAFRREKKVYLKVCCWRLKSDDPVQGLVQCKFQTQKESYRIDISSTQSLLWHILYKSLVTGLRRDLTNFDNMDRYCWSGYINGRLHQKPLITMTIDRPLRIPLVRGHTCWLCLGDLHYSTLQTSCCSLLVVFV